jgi:nucleotide-binding universal stress UspA family protein
MYKKIFIPVDNSEYSSYCTEMGVSIAERLGSQLIGSHVFSAGLHDKRFKDMEKGLPGHFQEEERLMKSRMVHNSLIEDGLRLISNAYLDLFEKKCTEASLLFERRLMEGKNWLEIVKDVRSNRYDLVIIGILGLGAVNGSFIGGVCERVVRRVTTDVLVVKNSRPIYERIVVAIDGSDHSLSALNKALVLGKLFDLKIEVVSAYDPRFHRKAFEALAGVLCEEAGKMFKFQEQEKLHDEIIDDGLGKIYQGYLKKAVELGIEEGTAIKTTLLEGKPYQEICKYLETAPPSLLVISRFGAHRDEESEIGNTAENLLRLAPCNVLMSCSSF